MNTLLTAPLAVASPAPDADWIVGACPSCGAPTVLNSYHTGGVGYQSIQQCWEALGEAPTCSVWNVAAYQPAAEGSLVMQTVTETPTLTTNTDAFAIGEQSAAPVNGLLEQEDQKLRESFVMFCDVLRMTLRLPDPDNMQALDWFQDEIRQGRAGFCTHQQCSMPTHGGLCLTCLMLPPSRRALHTHIDAECLEHYRNPEARVRDYILCRVDLIRKWWSLYSQAEIVADAIAYCEAGAAAERDNTSQFQEAA